MKEKWTFDGQSVLDGKGNNVCTKPNGQLISAAPDLLYAAKIALGALNDIRTGQAQAGAGVFARTALEQAISKATPNPKPE